MKLKPLGDRLIVKPTEKEEKTPSGIVLPDTAQEKPRWGEVVAVSEGRWDEDHQKRIPLNVEVGDQVLFGKYAGGADSEFTIEGEDVLFLRESDLWAKA
jgi:chaperonin GroES